MGVNRKYLLLGVDLAWVALSPFAALLVRDHLAPHAGAFSAAAALACLSVAIAAVVFPLAGLNRSLWRYTSLAELGRLQLAVTVTVLLALLATFANTRLLDIPRSLPVLQWFFLVAGMTGTRLAIRIWRERHAGAQQELTNGPEVEHVLIVGVNQLAEVYLRAMAEFAAHKFSIAGMLAKGTHMPGRLLRSYKVLGAPEDLVQIAQNLEVHGTWIDRVVVTEDPKKLSTEARQALLDFEKSADVKIDWLSELLGFTASSDEAAQSSKTAPVSGPALPPTRRRHRYPKRLFDMFAAAILLLLGAPLLALLAALMALDVGLPVVFWQHRPGLLGRHFKLYKFRTMRAPHDEYGNRIPDERRTSRCGALVRLSRLDELPQLYNILVGEMSFIGPRPLLVTDHEPGTQDRLLVRPGLTGWAQVNGGRKLSPKDKAALDIWYVAHLSLGLDFRITLRTVLLLFSGERIDPAAVSAAHAARPIEDAATGVLQIAPQPLKVAATVQSAA